MSRRILFALALAASFAPAAFAADPKEETAETVDGVKIRCRFYKTPNTESNGSCVILMHDYNADPDKGDWDGLARFLSDKVGVNVMRFDFRGHGQSKEITADKFWSVQTNQQKVAGYLKKPIHTSIEVKDFKPDYYPMLVNDLAAVRTVLDLKNDKGLVNTRTVYLIASGSAAPLAYLFLATEWNRLATKPPPTGLGATTNDVVSIGRRQKGDVAGKDYAGVILLTPTSTYTYESGNIGSNKATRMIPAQKVKDWVNHARDSYEGGDLRSNSSMLVFVSAKDAEGEKTSKFYFDDVMAAEGKVSPKLEPMKNSKLIKVPGEKEKGVELLGKNSTLKTEDIIKSFIDKIESDRKKLTPFDRKYDKPFRINMVSFGADR